MSITFHCDGDGCDATAPPGTVTGGLPGQWTVDYVYEKVGGGASEECVRVDHLCAACKAARYAKRDEPPAAPKPPRKRTRKPASKDAPKKRAPRKRAPKPKPPPEPVDDDEQGGLF